MARLYGNAGGGAGSILGAGNGNTPQVARWQDPNTIFGNDDFRYVNLGGWYTNQLSIGDPAFVFTFVNKFNFGQSNVANCYGDVWIFGGGNTGTGGNWGGGDFIVGSGNTAIADGNGGYGILAIIGTNNVVAPHNVFAFGKANTVYAPYSIAVGEDNVVTATAYDSRYNGAFGKSNILYQGVIGSFAFGSSNVIGLNSTYNFVVGFTNTVSQDTNQCFVSGLNNVVAGNGNAGNPHYNAVFGYGCAVNMTGNLVTGYSNSANSNHNIIAGDLNSITGGLSAGWNIVNGRSQVVSSNYSIITGANNTVSGDGQAVFGQANSVTQSPVEGYNIVGGWGNTVTGSLNLVVGGGNGGGWGNVVSNSCNIVGGRSNNVQSGFGLVSGESNVLVGSDNFAIGLQNNVNINYGGVLGYQISAPVLISHAFGLGGRNLMDASNATIVGNYGHLYNQASFVVGGGVIEGEGERGSVQHQTVLRGMYTDNDTPKEFTLVSGGAAPIICLQNKAYLFKVSVVAKSQVAQETAGYTFEFVFDSLGAGTARVSGITKNVVHEDVLTWDCNVVVDVGNNRPAVMATGDTTDLVHWVAKFDVTEVG
jgi:hypothetical protein